MLRHVASLETMSLNSDIGGFDDPARPKTPMTPASELGFELKDIEQENERLSQYVKAVVVDLNTLIPHNDLHFTANEIVFNEIFTSLSLPVFKQDEQPTPTDAQTLAQDIETTLLNRNIQLPWGSESDTPGTSTILSICKRREQIITNLIDEGVTSLVYTPMVSFLKELQSHGVKLGVTSSCEHARYMLEESRLAYLFQTIIDPEVMLEYMHRLKPSPDCMLKACSDLGLGTAETIAIEATSEGIQAAREGNFGLVIGVTHASKTFENDSALRDLGAADFVTDDISAVTMQTILEWYVKGVQKDSWKLAFNTFSPSLESTRETLTTVGNGYFSSRGCFEMYSKTRNEDNTSLVHYPGHYINGVYSRTSTNINGETVENSDLVNCPDWSMVRVAIGDEPFVSPLDNEILNYSHQLNLQSAVMERSLTFIDSKGRISRIESSRLVSMDLMHIAAINFTFTAVNYNDRITIRSGVNAGVKNELVQRYKGLQDHHIHLEAAGQPEPCGPFYVVTKVKTPETVICTSVRNIVRMTKGDASALVRSSGALLKEKIVFEDFTATVSQGGSMILDKIVSVYTTRDAHDSKDGNALAVTKYSFRKQSVTYTDTREDSTLSISDMDVNKGDYHHKGACADLVNMSLKLIEDLYSYHRVLDPHRQAWQDIWDSADLQIEGDRACQRISRIHTYNLFVTASQHLRNIDAGILARGLHGESYRGHVFWDELYTFSFYLSTNSDVCKGHLDYRYKRLQAARDAAKEADLNGAMYPWQSADTGAEATQSLHFNPLDNKWYKDESFRQNHVNIAVFYDAWLYYERARDPEMHPKIVELMVSIAVFWVSKCVKGQDDRYHIYTVMGPDEFHDSAVVNGERVKGVPDNAYTNLMVVWLLLKTIDMLQDPSVSQAAITASGVTSDDIEKMFDITKRMFLPILPSGVIEQFSGFAGLPDIRMSEYNLRTRYVSRMDLVLQAEGKNVGDYRLLKQADTLMLWYLLKTTTVHDLVVSLGYSLPDGFDAKKLLKVNNDFYVPITNDGSMLSYLVHAHIAGELGETKNQWGWFTEASRSDIYNKGGTTGEGIHCSVMAGSLSFIERWFVGLTEESSTEWSIKPNLPSHWTAIAIRRKICGHVYSIKVTDTEIRLLLEDDPAEGIPPSTFKIRDTRVQPGPWIPVVIQYNSLCKIKEFYDLMHKTWHHRKVMCNNYFMGSILCDRKQLQVLKWVHKTLSSLPKTSSGKAKLWLSGGTKVECELNYEIKELEKDICFMERGEKALVEGISREIASFDTWVETGVNFLKGISFKNWITDRDGTTNNYCGRYNSSVQSVYNSIWITRFALCCDRGVFITSAPLANPGIVNVSVNFEHAFVV